MSQSCKLYLTCHRFIPDPLLVCVCGNRFHFIPMVLLITQPPSSPEEPAPPSKDKASNASKEPLGKGKASATAAAGAAGGQQVDVRRVSSPQSVSTPAAAAGDAFQTWT